jgi:hypothetical protein
MATTTLQPHPAIQKYLTALEASLRKTPGMSPDDGLADAHEFLQSEWEAVQCQDPPPDGDLFQHFVERFGTPEEVAAEYAAASDLPGDCGRLASDESGHEPLAPRLLGRRLRLHAAVAGLVLAVVLAAAAWGWRFTLGLAADTAGGPVEIGPAWAGRVVSFSPGDPPPSRSIDPEAALGPPDCPGDTSEPNTYVALGRGGQLVLEFIGAKLYDGEGPDLKIVEIGPLTEAVEVAVSDDGEQWLTIGCAKGAESTLDLAAHARPGDRFRYVRLVDLGKVSAANNKWPGADIDAVGALHAVGDQ